MFPDSAPFFALQGCVHCPLHDEFAGERKSRIAPKLIQGYAPASRECVAPLGGTSQSLRLETCFFSLPWYFKKDIRTPLSSMKVSLEPTKQGSFLP